MRGRFEVYNRPGRAFAAWPTNDDLTLVIGGWPFAEFEANKRDIEGNYLAMFELAPHFADRIRSATREERFVGTAVPNFLRKPYGPGWALVGDAGYQQGLHHLPRHPRRLPGRRAVRHRATPSVLRCPIIRGCDG